MHILESLCGSFLQGSIESLKMTRTLDLQDVIENPKYQTLENILEGGAQ